MSRMNIRKRTRKARARAIQRFKCKKSEREKKGGGGGVVVFGSVASCWLLLKSFVHDVYIYGKHRPVYSPIYIKL